MSPFTSTASINFIVSRPASKEGEGESVNEYTKKSRRRIFADWHKNTISYAQTKVLLACSLLNLTIFSCMFIDQRIIE